MGGAGHVVPLRKLCLLVKFGQPQRCLARSPSKISNLYAGWRTADSAAKGPGARHPGDRPVQALPPSQIVVEAPRCTHNPAVVSRATRARPPPPPPAPLPPQGCAMAACKDILSRHGDAWTAATTHPFLTAVQDGTITPAQFDAWLGEGGWRARVGPGMQQVRQCTAAALLSVFSGLAHQTNLLTTLPCQCKTACSPGSSLASRRTRWPRRQSLTLTCCWAAWRRCGTSCTGLRCAVLCCAVLCCAVLCCSGFCSALRRAISCTGLRRCSCSLAHSGLHLKGLGSIADENKEWHFVATPFVPRKPACPAAPKLPRPPLCPPPPVARRRTCHTSGGSPWMCRLWRRAASTSREREPASSLCVLKQLARGGEACGGELALCYVATCKLPSPPAAASWPTSPSSRTPATRSRCGQLRRPVSGALQGGMPAAAAAAGGAWLPLALLVWLHGWVA